MGELFHCARDDLADITLLEALELLMKVWVKHVSEKLSSPKALILQRRTHGMQSLKLSSSQA